MKKKLLLLLISAYGCAIMASSHVEHGGGHMAAFIKKVHQQAKKPLERRLSQTPIPVSTCALKACEVACADPKHGGGPNMTKKSCTNNQCFCRAKTSEEISHAKEAEALRRTHALAQRLGVIN